MGEYGATKQNKNAYIKGEKMKLRFKKYFFSLFLSFTLLFMVTGVASALPAGTIMGTVFGADGPPLIGATVTALPFPPGPHLIPTLLY